MTGTGKIGVDRIGYRRLLECLEEFGWWQSCWYRRYSPGVVSTLHLCSVIYYYTLTSLHHLSKLLRNSTQLKCLGKHWWLISMKNESWYMYRQNGDH